MSARAQAVLGLVVVAGVAACGGGSSGGSSAGSPPSSAGSAPKAQGSPAAAAGVQHPKSLVGEVGEDDKFVIELHDENDKPITNLAAGTYALKVEDYSAIHNFHLSGSGVDDSTDVGGKGTKTFSVTFTPGTYTFVCDPHSSQMKGSFRVS